jgi:hypothetical protein
MSASWDIASDWNFRVFDKRLIVVNLRVYTAKSVEGVEGDFVNFFEALDIDQSIEDFIKAYWVYPSKIRFELVDIEEP